MLNRFKLQSIVMIMTFCAATGLSAEDPQIPAFPGAEGFGAVSKGGRVIKVTNLNADGET